MNIDNVDARPYAVGESRRRLFRDPGRQEGKKKKEKKGKKEKKES